MKVYLNSIDGIADAMNTLYLSKRSWTRKRECDLRKMCDGACGHHGELIYLSSEYNENMEKLLRFGRKHITMLKFIDFSFTVDGLHRAGQDDWDAHAVRYNNRIIRASTRLAEFGYEMSDWYKDKIIPTDMALVREGIEVPDTIIVDGETFVKVVNGYVKEEYKDDKDVLRGLYMESIPSTFAFKVNLAEFAHVYKLRNKMGTSNPEVKELAETCAYLIQKWQPAFTRELLMEIEN